MIFIAIKAHKIIQSVVPHEIAPFAAGVSNSTMTQSSNSTLFRNLVLGHPLFPLSLLAGNNWVEVLEIFELCEEEVKNNLSYGKNQNVQAMEKLGEHPDIATLKSIIREIMTSARPGPNLLVSQHTSIAFPNKDDLEVAHVLASLSTQASDST